MNLDSWLIARLAAELHAAVNGDRVQRVTAGAQSISLHCYGRGDAVALSASVEPEGPLAAAIPTSDATKAKREAGESGSEGWAGGVAPLLRGCIVESVHAVPNDRIINVDLVSRSAFGVPSRHRLALELIAPVSNAFVLRALPGGRWQILAACRKSRSDRVHRALEAGDLYEPPPARVERIDAARFSALVDAPDELEPRAIVRALGDLDPACTPPLAREVLARECGGRHLCRAARTVKRVTSERLLRAWKEIRGEAEQALRIDGPVYVWRESGAIALCHIVRLTWPSGDASTAPSVNAVCVDQFEADARKRSAPAASALRKRLSTLIARGDEQRKDLETARARASDADEWRLAGEAIYNYLSDIPERAASFVTPEGLRIELDPTKTAKQNAAAYFKRLKKARTGLPHIKARLAALEANRRYWEDLLWEIQRAHAAGADALRATCDEVERALGGAKSGAKASRAGKTTKVRAPAKPGRTVVLSGGAVAHVGRSPKDNERITFTVASPNDRWFHARNMPGAHVVLKLPSGSAAPTPQQIEEAAALAAGQSRAADAGKVEVDHTQRKHVRRQGGGRVGAVYYTHARTVIVAPRAIDAD